MPEGYTHLRCAHRAARALGLEEELIADAFDTGANGPDILFCYQVWKPAAKRDWPLPAFGARMHEENTGAFLRALIARAGTPAQRSYALGFVCHYAADGVLHPYVERLTMPGQLYGMEGGHGYLEIALDSELHRQDTGDAAVPVRHCCPLPSDGLLEELIPLLGGAIEEAYGERFPAEVLRAAFVHSTKVRGLFTCRFAPKRWLLTLLEPLFGKKGTVTGHITPARLKPGLPDEWQHPVSGETIRAGLPRLLEQAEQRCGLYMAACRAHWDGRMSGKELAAVLGSRSYVSGLEDARSNPA